MKDFLCVEKFVTSVFSSATGEILHNCYQITTIFPRISVAHCLTNKSFMKFLLIELSYFDLFWRLLIISTQHGIDSVHSLLKNMAFAELLSSYL